MAAFTDNFTGSSGQFLEARTGWTLLAAGPSTAGAAQINASNQLALAGTGDTAYQAQSAGSSQYYAQARQLQGAVEALGICVAMVDLDNWIGYRHTNSSGTPRHELIKRVGAAFTTLASFNEAFDAAAVIRVERDDTAKTVTVKKNGVAISGMSGIAVNDAVFNGVQTPGLMCRWALYDPWIDDWQSDALAASGSPYTLTAEQASFTLTGQAATLTGPNARTMAAGTGSFTLTGEPAALTGPGARTMAAAQASFALTGQAAGFQVAVPAAIATFTLTGLDAQFVRTAPIASAYTLNGPSTGAKGGASLFTVRSNGHLAAPDTITPAASAGSGTFSPTSVTLAAGDFTSATFAYTPSDLGARNISVTDSGTLTDPAAIAFTAVKSNGGGSALIQKRRRRWLR